MRFTASEWRRIGVLAAISLLVVAVLVVRGGGGDEQPAVQRSTPTPSGVDEPSAREQVAQATASNPTDADLADTDADSVDGEDDAADVATVVQRGEGTFTGALTGPVQFGSADPDNEVTFSVAVEDGIGVDATELAALVDSILGDDRSWAASPDHSLVRLPQGGHFQLVVTSPDTTDDLCAPVQTVGQLSCAIDGVVAINLVRWTSGSRGWTGTLDDYRVWVINHEVGHQLGMSHQPCPGEGVDAPVMQQQSIDLDGCLPNPWPFPDGVDEPDTPVDPDANLDDSPDATTNGGESQEGQGP